MREFIEECKLNKLLKKEKKANPVLIALAVIGVIVLIAAVAYAIYRYFAPVDMDDIEFEDEFDTDFFEEDEIIMDDVFAEPEAPATESVFVEEEA